MTARPDPDPDPEAVPVPDYWNHNVYYHPLVLDAGPSGCEQALDVGCGDGLLAAKLAARSGHVTGIDASPAMTRLARHRTAAIDNVDIVDGDFLTATEVDGHPLADNDFVSAVAVVHHVGMERGLRRLAELVRPGGTLVVLGLAHNGGPVDKLISGLGLPTALSHRLLKGKRAPAGMPVQDAGTTWARARAQAAAALPDASFRRLLLWRYLLVWHKPTR
jgi:SAM-dependent methyltransferase